VNKAGNHQRKKIWQPPAKKKLATTSEKKLVPLVTVSEFFKRKRIKNRVCVLKSKKVEGRATYE